MTLATAHASVLLTDYELVHVVVPRYARPVYTQAYKGLSCG